MLHVVCACWLVALAFCPITFSRPADTLPSRALPSAAHKQLGVGGTLELRDASALELPSNNIFIRRQQPGKKNRKKRPKGASAQHIPSEEPPPSGPSRQPPVQEAPPPRQPPTPSPKAPALFDPTDDQVAMLISPSRYSKRKLPAFVLAVCTARPHPFL